MCWYNSCWYIFGGSSNGRTPDFESVNWGSTPCPPASKSNTTRDKVLTQPNQAQNSVRTLDIKKGRIEDRCCGKNTIGVVRST